MSDRTPIEWARHPVTGRGATWNPIRARNRANGRLGWHCVHVSEGCRHCYAERMNRWRGTGLPYKPGHLDGDPADIEVFLDERALVLPLYWRDGRGVFVGSMTDLFGDFVTDAMLERIFGAMALAPQHVFFVLTKRAARMRAWFRELAERVHPGSALSECLAAFYIEGSEAAAAANAGRWPLDLTRAVGVGTRGWPLPHVWLGVSCEDQPSANERIPDLLATPAAVRWVSAEPLLGAIDLTRIVVLLSSVAGKPSVTINALAGWYGGAEPEKTSLNWMIVGGESGPGARPMNPDWPRAIRDQCAAAGTPFFFKQWGEWIGVPDLRHLPGGSGPGFGAYDRCRHDMDAEAVRVGKSRAGRLLDGRTHNAMPSALLHSTPHEAA